MAGMRACCLTRKAFKNDTKWGGISPPGHQDSSNGVMLFHYLIFSHILRSEGFPIGPDHRGELFLPNFVLASPSLEDVRFTACNMPPGVLDFKSIQVNVSNCDHGCVAWNFKKHKKSRKKIGTAVLVASGT